MQINTDSIQSKHLPKIWSILKTGPRKRREIHSLITLESSGYSSDQLSYVKVVTESGFTRHEAILGWVISNMERAGLLKKIGGKGGLYALSDPDSECPSYENYKKAKRAAWRQTKEIPDCVPQDFKTITSLFVSNEPVKFRDLTTPQIEKLAVEYYKDHYRNMKFHNLGYLPLSDGEHYFAVFTAQY